ncbi:MAG: cyclic nucleotide-binding domain-containing protein [Deltaproteobacteria bacterium]|nr:cyclic nucleotide-binding domain-containing protein [Deltaproteobacteria bacterium]
MKCLKCNAENHENTVQCGTCGYQIGTEIPVQENQGTAKAFTDTDPKDHQTNGDVLKPLSGLRRTVSTEMVKFQDQLQVLTALNDLVKPRTYEPGQVLVHKDDSDRDLFFLSKGMVEISMQEETGNVVLNEIEPPYLLGDIAFLTGFPRTATATAKTQVEVFIMEYEKLMNLSKQFPDWLNPLLTAIASGIKSLHFTISELKKEMADLKKTREQ